MAVVCHVWAWISAIDRHGSAMLDRELATGPGASRPPHLPDHAWLAEQDAEAWWDDIIATGRGNRWRKPLADLLGDQRPVTWLVSARQLRLALRQAGLRDIVETAVQAQGGDLLEWWEYSTHYDRYHPMVAAMLIELGISADQADSVWALADSL